MKTLNGDKYIEVDYPEFSLIPEKKAIADIAEGCEILFYLREVKPPEMRSRFVEWILSKLREKYRESWPELWEHYLNSSDVQHLLAMMEIAEIIEDSGFGEE